MDKTDAEEEQFEKRGCSIALFRAVRDLAVERCGEEGYWSIGRLSALLVGNHEILKEGNRWGAVDVGATLTHAAQSSLIDLLLAEHRSALHPHPQLDVCYEGSVSRANVFVSFAYAVDFVELVDALDCYLEAQGEGAAETTFFWFDLFVNNQWAALEHDFDWWATTFRTAILEIGKTVLVLLPWNSPICLTRVWCLYEIYCSANLAVALSRKQLQDFQEQLREDFKSVQLALCKIDLEQATSYLPEDRERIFAVVRALDVEGGGFHSFNQRILQMLRDWIAEAARGMVVVERGDAVEQQVEQYLDMHKTANILMEQGKLDEAKELYLRALSGKEQHFGSSHPETLKTVGNMAVLLQQQGRMGEAMSMHERALAGKEEAFGFDHPETLKTVGNIAILLQQLGRLDEAKEMYERELRGEEQRLGVSHPDTLGTVGGLGSLLQQQGRLGEAKEMYERALKGKEEQLGPSHPSTLRTVGALASLLAKQGSLDEAKVLYERALRGEEEQLGPSNLSTLNTVGNIAVLLRLQGKLREAELMYSRALAGKREQLGLSHASTLRTARNLVDVLVQQGKLEEATALQEEIAV